MDWLEKFWVFRLDAFKSRKTAARKGKDVADATMDNLLGSFQVVQKHYREEEEKNYIPSCPSFIPVSACIPFHSSCIYNKQNDSSVNIWLLTYSRSKERAGLEKT